MKSKVCILCKTEKPTEEFYKRNDSPDGLRNDCKECRKSFSLANHAKNREVRNQKARDRHKKIIACNPDFYSELYARNKDKIREYAAKTYRNNSDKIKARVQVWASQNRGKSNAIKKAYKAAKSKACPVWVRENPELRSQMDAVYEMAVKVSIETGVKHHVDHIVPLRGETVSGLHVPWNLQILPGSENCRKSNKFDDKNSSTATDGFVLQ